MASRSPTTTDNKDGEANISAIHPDILQTHILTRLDGPALASASSASSQLHTLCTQDQIWRDICTATWPSVEDPLVRKVISTFPGGHRSFFSDSYPLLDHRENVNLKCRGISSTGPTLELISAVDMYYKDDLIFSKVQAMETQTSWFLDLPFRVDLFDQKEVVPTPIQNVRDNDAASLKHIEDNVTLSWVLIEPNRKRAANVSSRRPVTVERHWLTGDVQLHYSIIMADQRSSESVQCAINVSLGTWKEGEEMIVREVSLTLEDMEGRHMKGNESLVNLLGAMQNGKRTRVNAVEAKKRFEEFLKRKRKRREERRRREKALDMLCICTGVTILLAFCSYMLFR